MVSKSIIVAGIISIVLASTVFYTYATSGPITQIFGSYRSAVISYHNVSAGAPGGTVYYLNGTIDGLSVSWGHGYNTSQYFVINDEATWKRTITQSFYCTDFSYPANSHPCNVPRIDFATETVLAVFQGWKGSSGYNIKITRIDQAESRLIVHVQETVPDRSGHCVYAAVMTYPYQIVTIPKTQFPVSFQAQTVVLTC